jgi:hypothetical protein|tara:strand:+ start:286 stop:486 length:201 start_codon:yes stop_codon:yes gene_type:complete
MVKINGKHPFWGIARLVVIFTGLTVFLAVNSDSFDKTEVTTIIELLLVVAGFEAVKAKVQKKGSSG